MQSEAAIYKYSEHNVSRFLRSAAQRAWNKGRLEHTAVVNSVLGLQYFSITVFEETGHRHQYIVIGINAIL